MRVECQAERARLYSAALRELLRTVRIECAHTTTSAVAIVPRHEDESVQAALVHAQLRRSTRLMTEMVVPDDLMNTIESPPACDLYAGYSRTYAVFRKVHITSGHYLDD